MVLVLLIWDGESSGRTVILGQGSASTQSVRPEVEQEVVAQYATNFLAKMLGELHGGDPKTVAHVKANLVPYLSNAGLESNPGLAQLRGQLPVGVRNRFVHILQQ
jgi:hypothetical protein